VNEPLSRRALLGGTLGTALAAGSLEEQALLAWAADCPPPQPEPPPVEGLQQGKIGKLSLSRLMCGGNLFSGFAHSRELTYVSALMRRYFTPERVIETLEIAERNGVNAAVMRCDEHIAGILDRYRQQRQGKIQWLAQTYPSVKQPTENIQLAIDHGAVAAFIRGETADKLIAEEKFDLVAKVLDFIQQNKLVAGIGAHRIETIRACEKKGFRPDFYFKTFNRAEYHSEKPEEVAEAMKDIQRPWIAFKVLGAGVVPAREGFRTALSLGADFLAVGMFDFQVRDDAALVKDLLADGLARQRRWMG